MKYLFSVVIPVFNSESFISQTLDSVINQKSNETEIVIIDDLSTDKTKDICQKYKKKFDNIKFFRNSKNIGVGASRNIGISQSKGEYIIFVDSDDGLFQNALKLLKKEIKKKSKPEVIVVKYEKDTFPQTNMQLIKDNINNNNNSEALINYLNKTKFPFADCWSFVSKRSFIKKNEIYFPEIRIGESEIFVARLICFMKSFSFMPEKFYDKKDRDFSLNHTQGYEAAESTLILLLEFFIFNQNTNLSKIKFEFNNAYIQDAFGIFSSLVILLNKKEIRKLSEIIIKYKYDISDLVKLPDKIDLYKLIEEFGSYEGLIKFRDIIIENKINRLKKIKKKFNKIYTYCRHKYTAATIHALNENGYIVDGVIDDSEIYKGSSFLGFKTINSSLFFNIEKNNLDKILVIITHQRDKTIDKISSNLIKKGLEDKQILKIKY